MISTTETKLSKNSNPSKVTPYYVIERRDVFMYEPTDKSTPAGKDVIVGSAGRRFKRLASPLETQIQELQAQVKELIPEGEILEGFDIIHEMMKHVATNIQDIGVKPSNSAEINSTNIEKFLASVPKASTPAIYVPYGEYKFARYIHFHQLPLYFFGDSGTIFGHSSKLIFPADTEGIVIDRGGVSIQEPILERLCVIATGKVSRHDGIAVRSRVKLRDVTVKGFAGSGFGIWSNLTSEGSDSSGSVLHSCHSLENELDGFFIGREDANAVSIINCDARDNKRYGFNEDSFLGNNYVGAMGHYNAGGDFFVRDWGNNRSTLTGCYSEGNGEVFSQLGPLTSVVGGVWGAGYKIGSNPEIKRGNYTP